MSGGKLPIDATAQANIAEALRAGASLRVAARAAGVSVMTVSRYRKKTIAMPSTPTSDLVKRKLQDLTRAYERFERCPSRENYDAHQYALRQYEIARGKLPQPEPA